MDKYYYYLLYFLCGKTEAQNLKNLPSILRVINNQIQVWICSTAQPELSAQDPHYSKQGTGIRGWQLVTVQNLDLTPDPMKSVSTV